MSSEPTEYLTVRELADLLRIKERKVYDLASSAEIPCTRATGKLLFPRREIDSWLARCGSGPNAGERRAVRPDVFLGSHDPLLDWVLKASGSGLASCFDGSLDGLERFVSSDGIASALHIYEPATDSWNRGTVARRFKGEAVVLVEFCRRERGLVVHPDRISSIHAVEDLRGCRMVPRQPRSGSQMLLLHLLEHNHLNVDEIDFVNVAHTETDSAAAVLEGEADVALGLRSLAHRYRLGFVPLFHERYDLLVDRRAWFEPPFQAFLDCCASDAFRERAAAMVGYDIGGLGAVHFNG